MPKHPGDSVVFGSPKPLSCPEAIPLQLSVSEGSLRSPFKHALIAGIGHGTERFQKRLFDCRFGEKRLPQDTAVFFFHRHALLGGAGAQVANDLLLDVADDQLRHVRNVLSMIAPHVWGRRVTATQQCFTPVLRKPEPLSSPNARAPFGARPRKAVRQFLSARNGTGVLRW